MELLASLFGKARELVKARIEAHMKKKMIGLQSRWCGLSVLCRFYALEA